MKSTRLTASLSDDGGLGPPVKRAAAGSASTSAAAEALAAVAAAAAAAGTDTDYTPSGGTPGGGGSGGGAGIGSGGGGSQGSFLDVRREKNRLAAKRCRDRKQAHMVALEAELVKQQKANDQLSRHVVTLVGLYQQERKQKLAAGALLQALGSALLVGGTGGDDSPATLDDADGSGGSGPMARGGSGGPRPVSPPAHLSMTPLLAGGTKTLSEVLSELEAGLIRLEDVEGYVRELRALRLPVLPPGGWDGMSRRDSGVQMGLRRQSSSA